MNPSALLSPPSSAPQRSILHSQFLNPIPLRSTAAVPRRRFRVSFPRNSSAQSDGATSAPPPADVFGGKRELTGVQPLVGKLSPPLRFVTSAIVLAGAAAAGYGLGLRVGKTQNTALGGAVVLGAAGGAAVYALNASAPAVAAVDLHNYVAGRDDPRDVRKDEIEGIAKKYGVSKQDEAFNAELCDLYCRFVTSVIPPGSEELRGDEVDTILNFKNALGIQDPEAASMHMEIGRRIFRQRLETGDREGDLEQRRAFQKLIYVSTLVFGDASSFLLPWKRVFRVTDSQVEIAIRDNAQRLYASKLKSVGRDIDAESLVRLREAQLMYRLSDETAADLFKEHTRKLAEEYISSALSILKSRTRTAGGVTQVAEELDKVLALNSSLISLMNQPDAVRFAPGVGPLTLLGSDYDRKMDDLKHLYRAYVTDSLSGGRLEENKLSALNHLKNIFGLGNREAETIVLDVTSQVYRKRLSQAVTGGDLEAADSKAAFLQRFCEELHFDPQKASAIHEEIYRQKLRLCVADGELNEEDVAALLRLRVLLCIPQETIEAAQLEICGSLFEKVVKDAIASGVDGYDADVKLAVRKAAHGLRLSREAAMSIASKAVRKIFINYVKRARAAGNRTETAKELKKLIAFNTLVVTELVADIKGESSDTSTDEPTKEEEEKVPEDDEEWESIQTLRKIRPDKELAAKLGKPGQTEITLKDDLQERERTDLYKTYLLFCITGEVKKIPFGAQITTKKDDSEYQLLNQLGAILGLSTTEVVEVHRSLAEQAFRQQAEVILADGQLTKARVEQLEELQKQVGLPPQYVQKIIKSITTTKMASAIETAIGQGRLNIKQIRELKQSSVDLESMISETLRESLFKKTVDEIFSSGTGEFDEEEVYEKIPADLHINVNKARGVVLELAKSRLSNSLIQAVSLLRQKNPQGVVSSLNDMLACDKAVPAKPLSWDVPEELADLFAIYLKSDPAPEKLSRLQYLLGINDSMAASLREVGDRLSPAGAEEKFVF